MVRIRRDRANHVTIIDQQLIRDSRLTWKARGIFVYLWSQSDEWEFNEVEVARHAPDGRSSLRTGLKELEKYGYLERERARNKVGQVSSSKWTLHEKPMSKKPMFENPTQANPTQENRTQRYHQEKITSKEDNTNKELGDESLNRTPEVFNLWENNWGFPNAIAREDLTNWINDFGPDLVIHAITYALRRNVSSKGADNYLMRTFERYKQEDITTVEQAEKKEEQHRQQVSREFHESKGNASGSDTSKRTYW